MASGDYVVGRDIDFQYDDDQGISGTMSSSNHSPREASNAKKAKKRTKKKAGIEVDQISDSSSNNSPKYRQKVPETLGPRPPNPSKVKRKLKKPASGGSNTSQNSEEDTNPYYPASLKKTYSKNQQNLSKKGTKAGSLAGHSSPKSGVAKSGFISGGSQGSPSSKITGSKRKSTSNISPLFSQNVSHKGNKDVSRYESNSEIDSNIWYTSSNEERNRVLEFWRQLSMEERSKLTRLDKKALYDLIHQERRSCSCAVCGSKREAVDEELDELFAQNEERLNKYAAELQEKDSIYIGSGLALETAQYFNLVTGNNYADLEIETPQLHDFSRYGSAEASAKSYDPKMSFSGLLEKDALSPENLQDKNEFDINPASSETDFKDIPAYEKRLTDFNALAESSMQPMAHLSNAIIDVLVENSGGSYSEERLSKARRFDERNCKPDRGSDYAVRHEVNKQFVHRKMLSLFGGTVSTETSIESPTDTLSADGPSVRRSLSSEEIGLLANKLAKPILESSEDLVPYMTMKMLMSLGPACDSHGINLHDQRRVFLQIVASELSTKYPELVQDFFTEFVHDVEENNGQNLLNMLEATSAEDVTTSTINQTQRGMLDYYKQVQGEPAFALDFNLSVRMPKMKDSAKENFSTNIEDTQEVNDDKSHSDNTQNEETDQSSCDYDAQVFNDIDAVDDSLNALGVDEDNFDDEDDEDELSEEDADLYSYSGYEEDDDELEQENIGQLEELEAKRLMRGAWYLHYAFTLMFEQRILKAYREHVTRQRQQSLLAELAEEEARAELEQQRKQREKDKKKTKKLAIKQQREEEAQRKAMEAKLKVEKAEAARAKEAARRVEQLALDRAKQEAHRRKIEERMAQLALESNSKDSSTNSDVPASKPVTTSKGNNVKDTSSLKQIPPTTQSSSQNIQTKTKSKPSEKVRGEKQKQEKAKSTEQSKVNADEQSVHSIKNEKAVMPKDAHMKPYLIAPTADIYQNIEKQPQSPSQHKAEVMNADETHNTYKNGSGTSSRSLLTSTVSSPHMFNSINATHSLFSMSTASGTSLSRHSGLNYGKSMQHHTALADVSGLPSNLGGMSLSSNINNSAPGTNKPTPGVSSLNSSMSVPGFRPPGMGANLMNPHPGNSGITSSVLGVPNGPKTGPNIGLNTGTVNNSPLVAGSMGSKPAYSNGIPMNNNNPLGGSSTGVPLGMGLNNMGMYRMQQAQSNQPSPLPQYSSVSSFWSPNADAGWSRSYWADDRHRGQETSSAPQKPTSASPWSAPSSSSLGQTPSASKISEAARKSYAEVKHLGVDGFVPSQVLYHATQVKSGYRFSQNELYKSCAGLESFECLRDNVGLITHIKL